MVQAIAQLSRTMSIGTVAEYVETPEIQSRLVSLGVDYAQGFAVGRPQPLTDLLEELPLLCSANVMPADATASARFRKMELEQIEADAHAMAMAVNSGLLDR